MVVVMGNQVGFTGADSTGKSTLIKAICRRFEKSYRIETLTIGDIARSSPYPLVERQNIHSSNWILGQVKINELKLQRTADILICDRTVLDIWVFSKIAASLGHISVHEIDFFSCQIRQALRAYHVIFYSIIDDKVPVRFENLPNSNLKIREEFEDILLASIEVFQHETSFIQLPSSYENRIDLVISTLKSLDVI